MAKLTKSAQWMHDHPDDEQCPPGSGYLAVRWRRERRLRNDNIQRRRNAKVEADRARYAEAMKVKAAMLSA